MSAPVTVRDEELEATLHILCRDYGYGDVMKAIWNVYRKDADDTVRSVSTHFRKITLRNQQVFDMAFHDAMTMAFTALYQRINNRKQKEHLK